MTSYFSRSVKDKFLSRDWGTLHALAFAFLSHLIFCYHSSCTSHWSVENTSQSLIFHLSGFSLLFVFFIYLLLCAPIAPWKPDNIMIFPCCNCIFNCPFPAVGWSHHVCLILRVLSVIAESLLYSRSSRCMYGMKAKHYILIIFQKKIKEFFSWPKVIVVLFIS